MKICGLQKTTLLDFPGHVAATVFTGGCNFRCPFCHNSDLLEEDVPETDSAKDVLAFLARRKGILEGVAITGGEPTLQPDLRDFIVQIRSLGYRIKLDTNGYRPKILKELCEDGLIDYVAMDIKTCRKRYAQAAGLSAIKIERIDESLDYLRSGKIPYEFRTTVVKGLHTEEDFKEIGPWIEGCGQYFLQDFVQSEYVPNKEYTNFSRDELTHFMDLVRPYVKEVQLRGVY